MQFSVQSLLLHQLHRATQVASEKLAQRLGKAALTQRQIIVLAAIAANSGVSQADLVRLTHIDRSTIADMVGRLVKRDLVCRLRQKYDPRVSCLLLTDEGHRLLAFAGPILNSIESDMLATIPAENRTKFVRMVGSLLAD